MSVADCTKDCTVDCGTCKGDPIGTLKRCIMRQLGFSRSAHGCIPFDKKDAWDDGYREAKRAVMRVLYPRPGAPHSCGTWPHASSDLDIAMPEDNARIHIARGCCVASQPEPESPEQPDASLSDDPAHSAPEVAS